MAQKLRLNYDNIASEYNLRYDSSLPPKRANALFELVQQIKARRILEAGCGTGFWLNLLAPAVTAAFGMDYSSGMLALARERSVPLRLSRGDAVHFPYADNFFDLVYCVDAIHHFGDQRAFIADAFRVLRPGGALAVLGSDPHSGDDTWYVHDYFQGVLEADLQRFPSQGTVLKWMQAEGFQNIASKQAEHISAVHLSKDVLRDPFLKKNSCSQLAMLSDEAYQAGLEKIRAAIARDGQIRFLNELWIKMVTGFKP